MGTKEKHLYYLNELSEYKIEDDYPDIRGWVVKDANLRNIGSVKNLLVNKKVEKVVYLDVEVDATIIDAEHDPYYDNTDTRLKEFVNEKGENHIIIPIGQVDINMAEDYIFSKTIDHNTFASTKRIRENSAVDRSYENAILNSYNRRFVHRPKTEHVEREMENAELYKQERRENLMEPITDSDATNVSSENNEVDWFNAKNETIDDEGNLEEDESFYGRKEFDDSRFRKK
ncbi:photosystem reaction center subunit H [Zobellia galactanivorans]|uniref:photosystem reaction center subunit H n=1 Tax=Zobellia galactanivorans (strain DSM 12802 / CCUG 47099 / CIP 106680 / NCIMB 13871 / Dsij) TaxID=63186 RepID=UPI001C07A940|nr:photosystem reaction center subunit H [Zobellia galactanivorans]MBU3025205.1 photosystem reaction center subunit H [Zobellia galactanivorans]MDO6810932.1 photosystem reaction center subunit H [Zobellia galactanivorans]